MTTRRIILMRHAKAEDGTGTDIERALTDRGRDDARAAGAWMRARGRSPYGLALVSNAKRAAETFSYMVEGGAAAEDKWVEPRLYQASAEDYLKILADVPAEAKRVLVIAHAPAIGLAGLMLADEAQSDQQAWQAVKEHVPTAGLLSIETETPWNELHPGCGRLLLMHTARGGDPLPEQAEA